MRVGGSSGWPGSVSRCGRNGYDIGPSPKRTLPLMRSNLVAAIVLIVVGLFLLASNLGWTNMNLGRLILTWWPVILVAVGIGLLFGRGK